MHTFSVSCTLQFVTMESSVIAPLHVISPDDAMSFVDSRPSEEDIRKLQKSELLLVAQALELPVPSYNNVALVSSICHKLYGDSPFDHVNPNDVETESEGGWKSRENLHATVIHKTENVSEEQAKRDHEYRML